MTRSDMFRRFHARTSPWDIIVVGGGATGVGVALDAATRGYDVLLLEQSDFGKGTSSRSTKLVHGGVRYLEQGNVALVMEALKERGLLAQNAPHLVRNLGFVVPNYDWWEAPFYGIGLKLYNLLAGKYGFGASRILSQEETLQRLPTLNPEGLRGGVIYFDGQFDDSRLLINLAATAFEQGAVLLNYAKVTGVTKDAEEFVDGVAFHDAETGEEFAVKGKVVVNATGPFTDALRRMADAAVEPMIAPSQGIHLVFDGTFLPGDSAIMVPHTSDGRVLFAIPWHGHTVVGTTDTPVAQAALEPIATEQEVEFILQTASLYLARKPARADVLSVFAGIRALVRSGESGNTSTLSRDHTIRIENSGLLTICGGKWTTYRHMAEDCVDQAATLARLPDNPCITAHLNIHGFHSSAERFGALSVYGSDAPALQQLMKARAGLAEPLHPSLPYTGAEVVWAAREEMACTVEDVLARRTRALFLNARAAIEMAPRVADLLARELNRGEEWKAGQLQAFRAVAQSYLLGPA
ncbi:MAG TPA: FAD-dependent oxidoreductase [Bryobacteraceae bacterium]|jgi:glycerol-3-phosphate dehydrogenase|nr:FAD-dependent oxidoreductase [Bryobacteraceae bacterium]